MLLLKTELIFVAIFFVLIISPPAFSAKTAARESAELYALSLEDLLNVKVSTASLRHQSVLVVPSKVQVISKTQIVDRNYRYLSDLIKDLPAVQLSLYSASPDSGSSQMIVRGISGNNKIVLMWNGQRLNHPDAQPLHITPYLYPLSGIEQVEVIYGSASALYGSDTVSMTINMISTVLNHEDKARWQTGVDLGRYHESKAFIHYSGMLGKVAAEFLLDSYQTHGIDFSGFEQFYSRYPDGPGVNAGFSYFPKESRQAYYHPDEESITARLRLAFGNLSFQSYFQRFKTQTQLGWSPLTYEADGDSGQYIFKQLGFFLSHKFELSKGVFLTSMLDHTRNKLDPDSHWNRPNAAPFRIYSSELAPRGIGTRTYKLNFGNRSKLEARLSWDSMDKRLHSVVGVSLTSVDMMPKSANLDFPGSYNNSFSTTVADVQKFHNLSENDIGIFIQGQYHYSDRFVFTGGGRFDKHNRYGTNVNSRLAVNYHHQQNGFFAKGIWGTSYLAPAAFFIFDTFLIPRDSQQVPNTGLAPEETTTTEVNVGWHFTNMVLELSLFHTKVENLIMQRQVKSVEQLTDELGDYTFTTFHSINSGETNIDGGTLEIKGRLSEHIKAYASYSYVTGDTQDMANKGKPYDLIHSPKSQVKLGIDTSWLDDALIFYFKARYAGKAKYHPDNYRFPASENRGRQFEMAAYWLLGLGGQYKLSEHMSIHFDVTNALDKKYDQPIVGQETSSWTRVASTPGIPRQFYFGIKAGF